MRKSVPVLLTLFLLAAFSMPAKAQDPSQGPGPDQARMMQMGDMDEGGEAMDQEDEDAPSPMCGPGCSCDKCMKAKKGMACGDSEKCRMAKKGMPCGDVDKCRMAGGNSGMMGMHGDIDMMTRPGMNKSCRTPEFYLRHNEELGLSPYQLEALNKLSASLRKDMITKGAAVKVLELDLGEIVTTPDFKLADAQEKLKEVEKARTDLRMTVLKASADARDTLSPEQLEKLKEINLSLITGGKMPGGPRGEMKEMMMEKMRQKMTQ